MKPTAERGRPSLRPHEALLLHCARNVVGDDDLVRIADVVQRTDWPSLLRLALHHRVAPLVHLALARLPEGAVPEPVLHRLDMHYRYNAGRSMHMLAALAVVADRLRPCGVPVLAYKGPVLALDAYGNVCRRQFGDIDILVAPEDYERARSLLIESGFRQAADWGWECTLHDPERDVCVDLHRAISHADFPLRLDFARLRERSKALAVGATSIDAPCPEDTLLMLCVQFAKDAAGENALRLSKLCDIAELVRSHPTLDSTGMLREAGRLGCARMLSLGLAASRRLLAARIPVALAPRLDRRHEDALIDHVLCKLFDEMDGARSMQLTAGRFHFMVRERWRDKLHPAYRSFATRVTPNELDRAAIPLPASLHALYFAVRPVRVAKDAARRLVRRLRAKTRPL